MMTLRFQFGVTRIMIVTFIGDSRTYQSLEIWEWP